MKKNNFGYTLVELIVVIVIIAIVSGITTIGITYFMELDIDSGLNSLQSTLDSTRYKTMSLEDSLVSCTVEKRSNCYYAVLNYGSDKEEYKLFNSKYLLYFVSGSNTYQITESDKLVITFNKVDGSVKGISVGGLEIALGDNETYFMETTKNLKLKLSIETGRTLLL